MLNSQFVKLYIYLSRPHAQTRTHVHEPPFCVASDFDECDETTVKRHLCAQQCTNVVGSYECGCSRPYERAADGRGCDGNHFFV